VQPRWRCRNAITTAQISSCWWTKDTGTRNGEKQYSHAPNLAKAAFVAFNRYAFVQDDKTKTSVARINSFLHMPNKRWKDKTVYGPLGVRKNAKQKLSPNDKAIDAWFDRITYTLTEQNNART